MFFGLPDPEFLCTDPDPSINKQKNEEKPLFLLFSDFFMNLSVKNDVNVGYLQKGKSIKRAKK
jgi:hypothetical protein